jgi:hypothetical protein
MRALQNPDRNDSPGHGSSTAAPTTGSSRRAARRVEIGGSNPGLWNLRLVRQE